jgi:hypothetical protein
LIIHVRWRDSTASSVDQRSIEATPVRAVCGNVAVRDMSWWNEQSRRLVTIDSWRFHSGTQQMPEIIIADDHPVVRKGLRSAMVEDRGTVTSGLAATVD